MIIYNDTEKELTLSDYKPIKESLIKYSLNELQGLYNNVSAACYNAYINHSDLLAIALKMDLKKIDLYIRMKERKQAKRRKQGRNDTRSVSCPVIRKKRNTGLYNLI